MRNIKTNVVCTYLNESNEELSTITASCNNGVVSIDLKQFDDFDIEYVDLYISEIIDSLFEYTFDVRTKSSAENMITKKII